MTIHADISNVVLVTVDSLRADAASPYDADRHTPVLQELADRGTVFENAFATGNWTPFSFPGLLASRPVFADSGRIGVDDTPTLAETLTDAGIRTGGFNAANGFLTEYWGYDEGFDEFEPFVADVGSSLYGRYLAAHPTVEGWLQLAASPFRRLSSRLRRDGDDRPFLDTSRMLDAEGAATSFLERADEPFFLWIHYMDAHTPYVPAPRYIREVSSAMFGTHRMLLAHTRTGLGWEVGDRTLSDLRTLYQGAVRQVDASIGRLLDSLDAAGHREETAVVVAGDHGEEFQEHGHLAHYPKLYDELIHVPLLVDVPGADARRIEGHVGLDAVPPTVLDLFGVDSPAEWRGESLLGSVVDGADPEDKPVVSVAVRGDEVTQQPIPRALADGDLLVSARTSEWTYIENTETGDAELYHRPSDPTQQTNRAVDPTPEDEAVIARLREPVREHAKRLADASERGSDSDANGDGPEADAVDDAVETRLSALGYR
ncbi:sulfatase [Haloprofundus marisrubri]|uniref:Sulfatase n=1 Tax=Haloprofundus marisrubri TaxID=1514971 RepID=A0A0W1RB15_9EURY|nr:sulfatase-like hydrolase/transferase [Haloprofundus marisrubri]KTG10596.1 sulfatase [Haloprofundus marisrubri]